MNRMSARIAQEVVYIVLHLTYLVLSLCANWETKSFVFERSREWHRENRSAIRPGPLPAKMFRQYLIFASNGVKSNYFVSFGSSLGCKPVRGQKMRWKVTGFSRANMSAPGRASEAGGPYQIRTHIEHRPGGELPLLVRSRARPLARARVARSAEPCHGRISTDETQLVLSRAIERCSGRRHSSHFRCPRPVAPAGTRPGRRHDRTRGLIALERSAALRNRGPPSRRSPAARTVRSTRSCSPDCRASRTRALAVAVVA